VATVLPDLCRQGIGYRLDSWYQLVTGVAAVLGMYILFPMPRKVALYAAIDIGTEAEVGMDGMTEAIVALFDPERFVEHAQRHKDIILGIIGK